MFQEIQQSIGDGRNWSWALIAIVSILVGLTFRQLVLGDLLRKLKNKNKTWYKKTQQRYESLSLIGWGLFVISIFGFIMIWHNESLFTRYLNLSYWLIVFSGLIVVSYIFHLRAYMQAMVDSIQENIMTEKELTPHAD
ncbi:MAG: hypothetical protein A3G33_07055 [Omnitrophica bacterium RIFCSPLOWO2_12_FULL_44_17]|uniref:Uncharacterized protein n=1 Tax=Candidatus Danuiimicrobium aquiferis TaxID=1801832 RepID=A0A1G1KYJ6_9BACT|nr:MAG: hypothetical protein A3B72_07350 [Omnitrophica bacterium RIFCSPHIGHO2_02_FULL_45_28]OGW91628.1 MAG: hypothetical protein A3E74_08090 [Omnitrophica bacterium RIFCSPHIGHO2_12_FULL_44_12]OGW97988.1 MAG: hypothetical protein A3G33_07055 [Omnitrophica bacterium RIFCSPLOWO2_12_FULL_44_17]OGX03568.1 MAG: hypothetical protein A3J12_03175 [Omnitrophica bacterium RIFCSPLOWO2_02_FULL_44_11]